MTNRCFKNDITVHSKLMVTLYFDGSIFYYPKRILFFIVLMVTIKHLFSVTWSLGHRLSPWGHLRTHFWQRCMLKYGTVNIVVTVYFEEFIT